VSKIVIKWHIEDGFPAAALCSGSYTWCYVTITSQYVISNKYFTVFGRKWVSKAPVRSAVHYTYFPNMFFANYSLALMFTFMEPEGSLQCSQEPTTGHCPWPVESSQHLHSLLLK